MCNFAFHSIKFEHLLQIVANCMNKGVRKGGFGVNNIPFTLICYKNFITCAKDINCLRILFAC